MQTAILAGGCFWCTEAVFLETRGVVSVESGYIGGHSEAPNYEAICEGNTGHAEAVRLVFDEDEISFDELLQIFFVIHDPTQLNRQGNDVGTQYRSAIFPVDAQQEALAKAMMASLQGAYSAPVVTTVEPASHFYPAEAYHQRYYERHPNQGYCSFVVAPKVEKFRKTLAKFRK